MPQVWEILSKRGQKVGIYNVPMTYPVRAVNGTLIAGFDTPSNQSCYTYPATLKAILDRSGYQIDLFIKRRGRDYKTDKGRIRLARDLADLVVTRTRLCTKVALENGVGALTVIVYESPDRIQHYMWDVLERLIAGQSDLTELDRCVIDCYKALDDAIGQWIQVVSPDQVVIVSDHGFQKLDQEFLVNRWLLDHGYLVLNGTTTNSYRRLPWKNWLKKGFLRFVEASGLFGNLRDTLNTVNNSVVKSVDWDHTVAYSGEASENSIYIHAPNSSIAFESGAHIAGESKSGVLMAEIIAGLRQERDNIGRPVLIDIKSKFDAYSGDDLVDAPDLILEFNTGIDSAAAFRGEQGSYFRPPLDPGAGCHAPEGIILIFGKGVKTIKNIQSEIADIAPTLLYLLDEPVPAYMDGQVISETLTPEWTQAHPLLSSNDEMIRAEYIGGDTAKDNELLAKRLADLGYLD